LEELHKSAIRTVHIFARRGPEHVAFTSPELRELPKLEHTDVEIGESDIEDALKRVSELEEIPKDVKSNLDAMMAIAKSDKRGNERKLIFHFLASPIEIKGRDRVEEVVFAINEVRNGRVEKTDRTHSVKTGLVISAIGYQAEPITGIPFKSGIVEHENGQVIGTNIFVVGWAKRGPSGVIGTNKSDAAAVMELLTSKLQNPKDYFDLAKYLASKGVVHISQGNWEKLNSAEVSAGESSGKPRVKFTDRKEMLGFAG
jgi:ferredoxin--NADP+ reductase